MVCKAVCENLSDAPRGPLFRDRTTWNYQNGLALTGGHYSKFSNPQTRGHHINSMPPRIGPSKPHRTLTLHRLLFTLIACGVAILLLALPTHASWGDQEPVFLHCSAQCAAENKCGTDLASPLPLYLRLTFWTCEEECDYRCMHLVTAQKKLKKEEIEQYHGKWPFIRLFGLQEPASIAFSLLNGYQHIKGYQKVLVPMPPSYPMKKYYVVYCAVNLNAWIWSAVFHARDFRLTERLDYFAAASIIMYAAFLAVLRALHLYLPERRNLLNVWTSLCSVLYAIHVIYLASLERFDYTYNVIACAIVGIFSNLVWISWSFLNRHRPYAYKIAAMAVGISAFTGLELFDFPPLWGIFDAHSLWHASTILLVKWFYGFVRDDAEWEVRAGDKEKIAGSSNGRSSRQD